MPGMRMQLVMQQELVQELHLQQRLEQRLEMALQLRQVLLLTDGEQEAEYEACVLRRILKDLQTLYQDTAEFVERVGKRVRKKHRTPGTKSLVASLRRVAQSMHAPLEFLVAVVRASIKAQGHHRVPSEELARLSDILASDVAASLASRLVCYRFWEAGVLSPQYVDFLSLLELGVFKKMEAATFDRYLALLGEHAQDVKFLDRLKRDLHDLLPERVTSQQLEKAVGVLGEFRRLLGHLNVECPRERYRAVITDSADAQDDLPTIVAPLYEGVNPQARARLVELCAHKSYAKTTDHQRAVVHAGVYFATFQNQVDLLERLIGLATSTGEFAQLCQAALHAATYGRVALPPSINSAPAALTFLNSTIRQSAFAKLPWSQDAEATLEGAENLDPALLKILVTLASVYEASHATQQLRTLARITEHQIAGTFHDWRYGHELSREQLQSLGACPDSWIKNVAVTRTLAHQDAMQSKLDALALLQREAWEAYEVAYVHAWTPALAGEIQREILRIDGLFRHGKMDTINQRELGERKRGLLREFRAATAVSVLHDPDPVQADLLKAGIRNHLEKDRPEGELREVLNRALTILEAPEFDRDRTVTFIETDDAFQTLNLGVVPYGTCQRWTEATSQNVCTPSHATDAHIKVWYVATARGAQLGRAVVRLAWFKKHPLLVLEDTYARDWSVDHARALVLCVIQKAQAMSRETNGPVYIGYAWWRRDSFYGKVFKDVAARYQGRLQTLTFAPKLAPSLNGIQYSDALGGKIANGGERRKVGLSILTVDTAAEEEAAP